MFEESASAIPSSIWASMNSWFTPTVLFVLLNVMIGTIAFTSSLASQNQRHQNHHQNDPNQHKIARSPSVLQRLKSINFYAHHRSHQENQQDYSSLHHKPSSNSDNLFNLQAQAPDTQSQYFFQENSQENVLVSQSHSHYIFEQTHEQNPQETQTHFIFEQTHEQNPQESRTQFDFERTHEYNHQESQSQFDFERTHLHNPEKYEDRFDFDEKDSNLDDFKQARGEEKVDDEESEMQSMDEVYKQLTGSHFNRSKSDTQPASGEIPTKLPARMRKSASVKSAFGHFEEQDVVEARRPETVRERGEAKSTEDDIEVDAKADDFINKFKQQLKLQRLDSIIRYKDMIGRGSGGRS